MTAGTLLNEALTDSSTELEFALETQSGFLVIIRGSGNEGEVTLAVRRRVGTPPSSAVDLSCEEVKRLIAVLGELSPSAVTVKEKHNVVRYRDAHLDDLMGSGPAHGSGSRSGSGSYNQPEQISLDLFMERDFPELANRRKRSRSSSNIDVTALIDKCKAALEPAKPHSKKFVVAGAGLATAVVLALSAVATYKLVYSHPKPKAEPVAAAPAPTAAIETFSRGFVQDMLNFKVDDYRQAQVRAMAAMSPELSKKYWQETGFPLTRKQLRGIPQDQQVNVDTVTALPVTPGQYQVDVVGSVVADAGAKTLPLHIRLSVTKDGDKLTVTEQKDLSQDLSQGGTSSSSTASSSTDATSATNSSNALNPSNATN